MLQKTLFLTGSLFFLSAASFQEAHPPFQIQPYQASYRLELAESQGDSGVQEVSGDMQVDCQVIDNGWTFQQRGGLRILFSTLREERALGEDTESEEEEPVAEQRITWVYTAWEAKNGRHFRFIWRRWIDGFLDENIQGEVDYDPQTHQGKITYQTPQFLVQPVHGELLFPTAYLGKILGQMAEGAPSVVSALVFSGTSVGGPFRLNTFVGEPRMVALRSERPPLKKGMKGLPAPILVKVWPTFTAAHHPLSIQEQGDSEGAHTFTDGGVPVSSLIDLGEFKVKATLRLPR